MKPELEALIALLNENKRDTKYFREVKKEFDEWSEAAPCKHSSDSRDDIIDLKTDLGNAFVWSTSKKGYDYWSEVSDNLREELDHEWVIY